MATDHPTTKSEAVANGSRQYFTGVPCKRGHVSTRRVGNGRCIACEPIASREWREEHPGRNAEYRRRFYALHKESHRAGVLRSRAKNPGKHLAYRRSWYAANFEREAQRAREWNKRNPRTPERKRADVAKAKEWSRINPDRRRAIALKWIKDNPGKANSNTARRRARMLEATPPWADHEAIKAVYVEAKRLEAEHGVKYDVDHIVPLRGKEAWGLHVHWNLQIIPAIENRRKGNKLLCVGTQENPI